MVVLVWFVLLVFVVILLMFYFGISYIDVYFEVMFGLMMIGFLVLFNFDNLLVLINFWCYEMVWIGGMGLIVLVIVILLLFGIGGC